MKLKLTSIIIFVQSIEVLKDFYVGILALEIIEEYGYNWLLLKVGDCQIGLHKIGEQYLEENQEAFKFDNNTKIVFEVDEDLYTLREQLIAQQVTLGEVKTFDNYDYFFCDGEDPEGNVFQLKQQKPKP
ncbi:VOC family protein [Arcicella rosea]|uniref:Catechol-2,3-dioxygenase n=1 Tax=Arcicella rosea TaxID=502909 RepID=A0A841EKC0_9BACT|nr:VOC family protein [Arcicella rosea]MBB6003386.1 catechol-2,3-dioxygenase [Arcicella rosea]